MTNEFTFDEMMVLAMIKEESRSKSIDAMNEMIGEIEEDPEMQELVQGVMYKLENISDEEYSKIDFSEYDQYVDELDDYPDDEPSEPLIKPRARKVDFALQGMIIESVY